ncbi:MAG: hypothetical protein WD035_08270 [Balneolaceae bacterium]
MRQDLKNNHNASLQRRYRLTLEFMEQSLTPPASILDLGAENSFSKILEGKGYTVRNTNFDLDRSPEKLNRYDEAEICTAFEILEHLLNPLSVLENVPGQRLFASVPLDLWFASAYKNPDDPWDRHFHEFEVWQFDWLLDHSGWEILRWEKWTNPVGKIGIRPLLRRFYPRWYIVEAVKR